jgi:hypothetical protein
MYSPHGMQTAIHLLQIKYAKIIHVGCLNQLIQSERFFIRQAAIRKSNPIIASPVITAPK